MITIHFSIIGERLCCRSDDKAAVFDDIVRTILQIVERTNVSVKVPLDAGILHLLPADILIYLYRCVVDCQIVRMGIGKIHLLAAIEFQTVFVDVNCEIIQPVVSALTLIHAEGAGLLDSRNFKLNIHMIICPVPGSSVPDVVNTAIFNRLLSKGVQYSLILYFELIVYPVIFPEIAILFFGEVCCRNSNLAVFRDDARFVRRDSVVQHVPLGLTVDILMIVCFIPVCVILQLIGVKGVLNNYRQASHAGQIDSILINRHPVICLFGAGNKCFKDFAPLRRCLSLKGRVVRFGDICMIEGIGISASLPFNVGKPLRIIFGADLDCNRPGLSAFEAFCRFLSILVELNGHNIPCPAVVSKIPYHIPVIIHIGRDTVHGIRFVMNQPCHR